MTELKTSNLFDVSQNCNEGLPYAHEVQNTGVAFVG